MAKITFEPGDVVELKSGGDPMTVVRVDSDGNVDCVWFAKTGDGAYSCTKLCDTFPTPALVELEDDE